MKRILSTIVLLLWALPALAQVPMTGAGRGTPAVAPTYQGPGDVVTYKEYWGFRAYSAATAGTKIINLCDDLGNNCADILTNATTGAMNPPGTLGANNCNTSGTCRIKTVYDKSGGNNCSAAACDATQATNSARPTLQMSCGAHGQPCAQCVFGSNQGWITPSSTAIIQPFSHAAFVTRTALFTTNGAWYGDAGFATIWRNVANGVGFFAGSVYGPFNASDSTAHSLQLLASGASSFMTIDGTDQTTGNAGTGSSSGVIHLCQDASGNNSTSNFFEAGNIAGALNPTQRAAVNSNAAGFW